MMKRLTNKQENFCNEYVLDFNGTNAAIRAGYNKSGAGVEATKNLKKPNIVAKIKELTQGIEKEYKVNRAKILKAVEEMAYGGEAEANRRGALDMLMKHAGHYTADNILETTIVVKEGMGEVYKEIAGNNE